MFDFPVRPSLPEQRSKALIFFSMKDGKVVLFLFPINAMLRGIWKSVHCFPGGGILTCGKTRLERIVPVGCTVLMSCPL